MSIIPYRETIEEKIVLVTGHAEKGADYYDDIFSRDYNEQTRDFLYKQVFEKLMALENPRVLEVGCGTGYLARMIIEKGIAYRGFDFSAEAVRKALQFSPNGEFRVADAYIPESYLPVDYNAIICMEVLEHVDDLALLKNLPAGVHFIATVPDFDDVAHLRLYTDPERDIKQRYAPFMDVREIQDIPCFNPARKKNVHIYMFSAIIKDHETNRGIPKTKSLTVKKARPLKAEVKGLKLNIGCSHETKPGWVNIDTVHGDGVDVTADFNNCDCCRLPFEDDSVEEINCFWTPARVAKILPLMEELHRIAKNNARATFIVPYGSSDNAWEDPTLVRRFFLKSFNYFSQTYLAAGNGVYRGDWRPETIELFVDSAKYINRKAEDVARDIELCRNVVTQMKVVMTAIKPARTPGSGPPDEPVYRILPK